MTGLPDPKADPVGYAVEMWRRYPPPAAAAAQNDGQLAAAARAACAADLRRLMDATDAANQGPCLSDPCPLCTVLEAMHALARTWEGRT